MAPALASLQQSHPDLTIELVTATTHLGQSVRTFDLAVTLEEPVSERVRTRALSSYTLGLYASKKYMESHGPIASVDALQDHTLIWYVDQLLDVVPLRQINETLPKIAAVQSTNVIAHWQAAAAGVGIAPLPKFIAQQDNRLTQILRDVEFEGRFWLVIPRELTRLARVHAVADLLDEVVADRQAELMGHI